MAKVRFHTKSTQSCHFALQIQLHLSMCISHAQTCVHYGHVIHVVASIYACYDVCIPMSPQRLKALHTLNFFPYKYTSMYACTYKRAYVIGDAIDLERGRIHEAYAVSCHMSMQHTCICSLPHTVLTLCLHVQRLCAREQTSAYEACSY